MTSDSGTSLARVDTGAGIASPLRGSGNVGQALTDAVTDVARVIRGTSEVGGDLGSTGSRARPPVTPGATGESLSSRGEARTPR
jgi:hypothetical protein